MRHLNAHRKLRRETSHRLAMLRNLVTSLLDHERITTTDAKAKEVRPLAERIITYGKKGDLHARRMAMRTVRSKTVLKKVFDSVAKRFAGRPGGYTRIIKLGRRAGDGAHLSIIELLPEEGVAKTAGAAKKTPAKGKAAAKASRGRKEGGPREGKLAKAPRGGKKTGPAGEKGPGKGAARKGTSSHRGSTKGGD